MKRKIQIITGATAVSFLTFTALAQETYLTKDGGTETSFERSTHAMRAERLGRAEKASDLIGREVRNYQGEKFGKVDDLALGGSGGKVSGDLGDTFPAHSRRTGLGIIALAWAQGCFSLLQ